MSALQLRLFVLYQLATIGSAVGVDGYQSLFSLSDMGTKFSPLNEPALLLATVSTNSSVACLQACHAAVLCRIFEFDEQLAQCRLFEGDVSIMGTLSASSSSRSVVGSVKLDSGLFTSRGYPCSFCTYSRYLTCLNATCQCPLRTYFDGSICRSQNLLGVQCAIDTDCRTNLNLNCLPRKQCGPLSLQSGLTVAGSSTGVAGATLDALSSPFGIAIDNDHSLVVSDASNARVLRVVEGSLTGTFIAGTGTVGTGISQLSYPSHVFVDNASNIYVSDTLNSRVMVYGNGSSSGVSVTGSTPILGRVIGVAVDSHGSVYVAQTDYHRVTKWTLNGTSSTLVAGTGVAGAGSQQLTYPFGLHLDELQSYLYVADYGNNRIQRFTLGVSTNGITVAGGNGQGSNDNQLYNPQAVCVSEKNGAIYVADTYNNRITRWYPGATSGVTLVGIAGPGGVTATLLQGPAAVALSKNETYLYVADLNNNRVQRFELI